MTWLRSTALTKPVAEIVSGVANAYEVEAEQVRPDVTRFLSEMSAVHLIEVSSAKVSAGESALAGSCAIEGCLVEVPGTAELSGTEGPVGREGLAAAGAR